MSRREGGSREREKGKKIFSLFFSLPFLGVLCAAVKEFSLPFQ